MFIPLLKKQVQTRRNEMKLLTLFFLVGYLVLMSSPSTAMPLRKQTIETIQKRQKQSTLKASTKRGERGREDRKNTFLIQQNPDFQINKNIIIISE